MVWTSVSLVVVSGLAAPCSAATARPVRPADVVATRAYLVAMQVYSQAIKGDQRADEVSVQGLVGQIISECPNALAGSPHDTAIQDIEQEVFAEVAHALVEPQDAAAIAFAKKVEPLHWSSRKLTYYARGSAAETRANAELRPPDVCSDADAVAAGAFSTVPASTTIFLRQVAVANSMVTIDGTASELLARGRGEVEGLQGLIMRLLKSYERPNERSLMPRASSRHARRQATAFVLGLVDSADQEILHALGVMR